MEAYPDASTLVLRTIEPRLVDDRNTGGNVVGRTRFTVVTTAFPASGAGECSECPSDGVVNQAIGEVRYRSVVFRGRIAEAVCLPCLPGLLAILSQLRETPLAVTLYSSCTQIDDPRVQAIDARRAELVALITLAQGLPMVTTMLGQSYAATSAQLRRMAEVA